MAWNWEKQRWECDRCGAKIDASQTIQLCRECAKKVQEEESKATEFLAEARACGKED